MKYLTKMAAGCLLVSSFIASSALAMPTLSFNNSDANISQTYNVGDPFSLDLWISGLETDDLGAFNLNLGFNGGVTGLLNADYASGLLLSDFFTHAPVIGANSAELVGASLSFDLSNQADAFQIATLRFDASSIGGSIIDFSSVLLSDAFGYELIADSFNADITVIGHNRPTPVPEPPIFFLLLSGLGLGFLVSKRRKL